MNILLWALQIIVAFFCVTGSTWRFFNYEQAANDIPSMKALSFGMWNAIGAFEIFCALGLILPGVLNLKPGLTSIVALGLALELLLVSALHVKFFGLQLQASNPAIWSLSLCAMAVFIAYGRYHLSPL